MPADLNRIFCEGAGACFYGTRCEFYLLLTKECTLLKEHELAAIFAQGRCKPAEIVRIVAASNLRVYKNVITLKDHIERIIFEVTERLQNRRLEKKLTLDALKAYINRSVYNEVLRTLQEEIGMIPRYCGHCQYLSPSKPALCLRPTIAPGAGEKDNPQYEKTRRPSDRACQDDFEPFRVTSIKKPETETGEETDIPVEDQTQVRILIFADLLAERAARVKGDSKRMYERQYVVFCRFIQWVEKGAVSWEQWKQDAAESLRINVKTIARDVESMVAYLQEHEVL